MCIARAYLDAVHDALDYGADLVGCAAEGNKRSSKRSGHPDVVLRLDLDVPLDARHDLQALVLDDRKLALLGPAQALLELVEHRADGSLRGLDGETS